MTADDMLSEPVGCPWCQSTAYASEDQLRRLLTDTSRRYDRAYQEVLRLQVEAAELRAVVRRRDDRVTELEDIVAIVNRRLQEYARKEAS